MSCSRTSIDYTKPVWSKASTSDPLFIAYARVPANEAAMLKMSFVLDGDADLECRRAARYSNDETAWTDPAGFGVAYAGPGSSWGTAYHAVIDTYRHVELGLLCKNKTGSSGTKGGTARVIVHFRDDPFTSFGSVPTDDWGILEGGLTRLEANGRVLYYGASSPYGDVYEYHGSSAWSLSVVASNVGDPSGAYAWRDTPGVYEPVWIAYDPTDAGAWKVYNPSGVVGGSTAAKGSPHAVTRVSVTSGGLATFEVSFDGFRWISLYSETASWPWSGYLVQDGAFFTVQRELRS